ncbi:hypothetical protein AVEN_141032-1 [Araneus ventricosus]|uniref:Uncharacterized protein n=1 Tax=Araneus ventricosus TaxID=182803 RepID=A0A4Y1ZNY2_ARAVE|nr:hypothetical protein AVEN_32801-1 [Araneus ventricosus]GBL60288.1 hypothetical protein AVEN_141032-1 [Araneus ventricosus]
MIKWFNHCMTEKYEWEEEGHGFHYYSEAGKPMLLVAIGLFAGAISTFLLRATSMWASFPRKSSRKLLLPSYILCYPLPPLLTSGAESSL